VFVKSLFNLPVLRHRLPVYTGFGEARLALEYFPMQVLILSQHSEYLDRSDFKTGRPGHFHGQG
jgi:hypothetical protein